MEIDIVKADLVLVNDEFVIGGPEVGTPDVSKVLFVTHVLPDVNYRGPISVQDKNVTGEAFDVTDLLIDAFHSDLGELLEELLETVRVVKVNPTTLPGNHDDELVKHPPLNHVAQVSVYLVEVPLD